MAPQDSISTTSWQSRAGVSFTTQKKPATGSRGMVTSNHPLASAAGAEMLAAGGNAIDAAVATQFALTVVEPMMVGLIGGGMCHIRTADGKHVVIDGQSVVPGAGSATMYRALPGNSAEAFDVEGQENLVGPKSVAAPGSLRAWCLALEKYGTMSLADVLQPAIRHAARGFSVSPYLSDCIGTAAPDLVRDKLISARLMPSGSPLKAGERLVQGDYADSLTLIAQEGPGALHGGALGERVDACMRETGGFVRMADLAEYRPIEREPIRATYRGWEIVGPPPPAASGVHIAQMLNILEGYDIAGMGFGTAETVHLLAEVLKIAFADRAAASGDPDFVDVPVERITSKAYAEELRGQIDPLHAKVWGPGISPWQSAHTTHLTTADGMGNCVASTQTINNLFGARFIIPGTGMVPNNYMNLFDPRPGRALSIEPGKRVTTSMSPMMALRGGKLVYALGLPGGKRIFPSAMQALINLIDHGMSLQEAVEAPRIWTEGPVLELERTFPAAVRVALKGMGHRVEILPTVAGGMNAIQFMADGSLMGSACWRADGSPIGLAGGLAKAGVRFVLETPS